MGSGPDPNGTWSENTSAYAAPLRLRTLAPYLSFHFPFRLPDRLLDIEVGQFGAIAAQLDHSNDIFVWTGMWIPNSYAERTVIFTPQLGSLGLSSMVYAIDNLNEFGFELPIALRVETLFGASVQIPIVPVPSALAPLALCVLAIRRRR